nr:PREDICTED: ribonuclease P protein subunit p21 isoform X1 [Lepisosteus oculatus]XP_015216531.1 PREDICTED: ribonuclease P protein subunit p21 isoform X1 [Lepisosteus oculatus]XP_015216532.1 PREDICTED: ribonuclease P protein subunit p21 isoform X1 [Lepisosteus oculatus]XP_015216533.1 PREDICTED: ribonuclease P protein subunit p21 isoform X1 [Lepisosteus oculatus]
MTGNIKDKEAFQRLNFLYQAAHCVLAQNPENVELARFYCFTQKTISKRLVLRQDPSVKRTLCKKCCSLLVPGVTATVRQRRCSRRQRMTMVRCLSCGQTKRFPNNPGYQLWVDRPEAQLENQPQLDNTAQALRWVFVSTEHNPGTKSQQKGKPTSGKAGQDPGPAAGPTA